MKVINPKRNRGELPAGALYFALVASLIFSLLSASVLMAVHLIRLDTLRAERALRVLHNLESAIQLSISDHPVCALGDSIARDLFAQGTDSVQISRKPWGLLEVVHVRAFTGEAERERSFLAGYRIPKEDRLAIYLEDHNRALSVCGETRIEGDCSLPKVGVKRAYIEGKTYTGVELVHGKIETSTEPLPEVMNAHVTHFRDSLLALLPDYVRTTESGAYESFRNRVGKETLVSGLQSGMQWKGQRVLVFDDRIVIDSACRIEDAIVVAPAIRILKGFHGSAQFFAEDSIVLEDDVHLGYPSVLVVHHIHPAGAARIELGDSALVQGVVAVLDAGGESNRALISISKSAKVSGLVYSEGTVDHKGTVHGMVYTRKFLLNTPSSVYENHLLDATVSSTDLHDLFVFPASALANAHKDVAKWVN